ncbi:hypothetical protein ID866_7590 [Astraeus odoratus]|nr:hypothetical protein ID866_7590 [Astraeus odoratus]
MDGSYKPQNLFGDDEDTYIPSTQDKGKRKADDYDQEGFGDGGADINPSGSVGYISPYTPSYSSSDTSSIDLNGSALHFSSDSDSQSTASMPISFDVKRNIQVSTSGDEDDSDQSMYESVGSDLQQPNSLVDDEMDVDEPVNLLDDLDLAFSIKGLYRVLDLITEQGSGGLVDKIIISQHSLKAFVNTVCPGAYASMTKVNFKALDQYIIKPVGIYGSKEEIVRLFLELKVTDDAVAAQLLADPSVQGPTKPKLRSGLYILRPADRQGNAEQVFVVYWPEEGTWDDSAKSQIRRNRVTFMRYLTKLCDQIVALMSSEHAQSIIWNESDEDEDDSRDEDDEGGRIINCVVDRTTEQEESVQVKEGFKVTSERISLPEPDPAGSQDQAPTKPFLLYGETAQGLMTVRHQEAKRVADNYRGRPFSALQLESYLLSDRLCISESMGDQALRLLLRAGLQTRFPQECGKWTHDSNAVAADCQRRQKDELRKVKEKLDKDEEGLQATIHEAVVNEALRLYPFLDRRPFESIRAQDGAAPAPFKEIASLYPRAGDDFQRNMNQVTKINDHEFRNIKNKLCFMVEFWLRSSKVIDRNKRSAIMEAAERGGVKAAEDTFKAIFKVTRMDKVFDNYIPPMLNFLKSDDKATAASGVFNEAKSKANNITDSKFLLDIANTEVVQKSRQLTSLVGRAKDLVKQYMKTNIPRLVKKLVESIKKIREDTCNETVKAESSAYEQQEQQKLRNRLIHYINHSTVQSQDAHTLRINDIDEEKGYYSCMSSTYKFWGARETQEDPMTCFTIYPMGLTEQDQHNLQLDPSTIPSPRFSFEHKFRLLQGYTVMRAQLIQGEKLLLIVADRPGNLTVYLEHLTAIDPAITRGRGKALNREKIGQEFVLAFDESKRMLSIVSSDKMQLHIFVHDDSRGFQALGSSINLAPWYNEGTSIRHACFVSGSEELLLVDAHAQARIFSLVTMQFRPATLALRQVPSSVQSTPDGSCLLVSHENATQLVLTAYHWSSFGSTEGIELSVPSIPVGEPFVLTSLVSRTAVHLLWLDFSVRRCQSYALNITRRVTEFMFREKVNREVWTRFPVFAAVQRETISSASLRSPRSLVFVTDRDFDMFAPHFSDMVYAFERSTKKPTGDVLKSIKVSAASFPVFARELCGNAQWNVSQYRSGEWIVDFLCLIPIHIAVTKENRFIPLKDGVYSTDLERSLLGAEVNRIVDSISFGWYESLFQSYMATKPVRVVSSMGEQSVGKSYALNHLVDTSFAGSAMRTTEGVWMSVTPTEKELIVALDFEGVHSIERSAQEDTLLVLFNTAISNLVLFRNNFAFSRDITGLFQSFQSSATVLDPAANPSLFQSTLVIIIKDVVEADRAEIAREFSLKFQRIVQDEQEANFITRLHSGKLAIIPWPVIESKEFYKLFPALKRRLDQQVVTHHAAGEFLHKVKTLMAKLKANDWGAMSQTMASHRAQLLSALLPNALVFGFQEIHPEREPLKNLDTDMPVESADTPSQLFLAVGPVPQSEARERALEILRSSWEQYQDRQRMPDFDWVENLSQYLENIVDLRVDHVREWLNQNLSRFQAGHASIEELRRTFEGAIVDLKSNVQLCKLQCSKCQLLCIQSRFHDGPHDCQSNHLCIHGCEFCQDNAGEQKECSMTQEHLCTSVCSASGICEIETAPQSIEATFTGRHETFQYTKYSQGQLQAVAMTIPPGKTKHKGSHNHSLDNKVIHFCEARCENCGYFCHPQQEHETRHGSMSRTRWTVDGDDDTAVLEIEGRKFSTNDEGAPMMCNLVCQAMGRHTHIDYCRADDEDACVGNDEIHHISKRLRPDPDRPKDYLTHNLFWKRSGFKDPYSKEEQAMFAKCDAMCGAVVLYPTNVPPARRSKWSRPSGGQAFHVIFVADRSGSMYSGDRKPLQNHPASARIAAYSNNRFGAVLSSLFSFWSARATAIGSNVNAARRDAYSVILFNHNVAAVLENDFTSNPDQLLDILLPHDADGGTNFTSAVTEAQAVLERNWSTERSPVIIFLSDGECHIADQTMQDLCRASVRLGKAVSFHAVSFGPDTSSTFLRRMAEIAQDAQNNAPRDPLAPPTATVKSSYTQALDTVQLAETFLGIAESLRKPRGALMH